MGPKGGRTDQGLGFRGFLLDGLKAMGLYLDTTQMALLQRFKVLLADANRVRNLTAIESDYDVAVKHFLDSLSCLHTGLFERPAKVVDIGSGAGFPGVPLKVARPSLDITLVDSSLKKTAFLAEVTAKLELARCGIVCERAERLGRDPGARGKYDVAVVRAVASLPVDLEYGIPLLAVGGHLVAMKGPRVAEEFGSASAAAEMLGATLGRSLDLALPLSRERRTLVVFEKVAPTPEVYPRREGLPAKRPLVSSGLPFSRPG